MRAQPLAHSSHGPDDDAAAALEAACAIEYIEANLFADLSVSRIARACALSAYHFSRRFSRRSGESVMSYVRGRRLDRAASRLAAEPDTGIVDIALDCRFESQQAFTRAFTRAFGVSPDRYRRLPIAPGRKRRSTMMRPLDLLESTQRLDTFCVAGVSGRYDPSTFTRINELWKAFASRAAFEGRLGEGQTCGVFRERNFAAQSFQHLAGAQVRLGAQPAGLEIWTLPAREYLVFKQVLADGDLYPQVAAAQAEIWGHRLPRSGRTLAQAPDFQLYPAGFNVGAGGWIGYYIPVE